MHIDPDRVHCSFQQRAKQETQRVGGVDAIMITTPNNMYYPTGKIFLDPGFDVICDKPLTNTIEKASSLGDCAHFLSWVCASDLEHAVYTRCAMVYAAAYSTAY